jgi:hypothetical protein
MKAADAGRCQPRVRHRRHNKHKRGQNRLFCAARRTIDKNNKVESTTAAIASDMQATE